MKTRKDALRIVLITILGTALVFLFGVRQTLYGLISQKLSTWEEESYIGKPLSELQSSLTKQGRGLTSGGSEIFYGITRREQKPNQRVMYFTKGSEYPWFGYGTAINVGYVLVEKDGVTERIVTIIRARSVDSL